MHRSTLVRFLLLGSLLARPALAQQVVGHATLLPPGAGLNPLGLGAFAPSPAAPTLFALTARGVTFLDRGADRFVNFAVGTDTLASVSGMALDPTTGRLLVGDAASDELLVIDGSMAAVLLRLPLSITPGRIAVDDAGRRAFILDPTFDEIAVVDLRTLEESGVDLLPDTPSRLAVDSSTGNVYVTSAAAGETWALAPDLTLRATIATGAASTELALNPVRRRGYVVRTDGNVAIVDLDADSLIRTVAVNGARLVAAHPGNGFAYVTAQTAATPPATPLAQIVAIDTADQAQPPVAVGGSPAGSAVAGLALDAAGNRLFATEAVAFVRARVTSFDVAAGSPTRSAAAFTGDPGAAPAQWSAGTGKLYVAAGGAVVSEVDPVSLAATRLVIGAAIEGGVVNDARGLYFALEQGANQVATVDLAAPAAPPLRTAVGAGPAFAEISLNRGEVYVLNQVGRSISILDAATGSSARADKSPVPTDITFDFALDDQAPGGPRGVIAGLTTTLFPSSPSWVQTYLPGSGDALAGISGNCFTTPCIISTGLDVNRTSNKVYASAIFWQGVAPPASSSLAMWNGTAWSNVPIAGAQQFPSPYLVHDPAVNEVFVHADTTTQTRLVAIQDSATPAVVATLNTAAAATGLHLDSPRLYVLEGGSGQIEVFNTSTHALINPIVTGGVPVDVATQPGSVGAYVQNDDVAGPGIQVYDLNGLAITLTDIAYFGAGTALTATAAGRIAAVDNLHGSVAVIEPAVSGSDLQIVDAPLPDGTTVDNYAAALAVSGGSGNHLFEVTSGQLPPGVTLEPVSGAFSGTPGAEGMFSFLVRLTDLGQTPPRVDVEDFQIQVLDLRVLTSGLPPAACGAYQVALLATGGVPPYTWSSTPLPAGLSLDPLTGVISGTPTASQSCPPLVDFTVTDSRSRTHTLPLCLEVTAGGAPPLLGNRLLLAKRDPDVLLVFPGAPPPVAGHNVYRATPPPPVTWTRLGGLPSTSTGSYLDAGALPAPPALYWYKGRATDACGNESADPL